MARNIVKGIRKTARRKFSADSRAESTVRQVSDGPFDLLCSLCLLHSRQESNTELFHIAVHVSEAGPSVSFDQYWIGQVVKAIEHPKVIPVLLSSSSSSLSYA